MATLILCATLCKEQGITVSAVCVLYDLVIGQQVSLVYILNSDYRNRYFEYWCERVRKLPVFLLVKILKMLIIKFLLSLHKA